MKIEPELYWPEHKVYFVATLVLFPEKLIDHEVNPWFYQPYFIGKDMRFIGVELNEYQSLGYIKYEETHALIKIKEIDSKKATDDLIEYLKKWRRDELLSLGLHKPPDVLQQQKLLLDSIARAYAKHQKEPRITLEDVYGTSSSYSYKPPFWELVLSNQLINKKLEIKYMGYDRREDGTYEEYIQPVVDLKIIDKDLKHVTEQAPLISSEKEANVFMQGRNVCISISGDKTYSIAKLGDKTTHYIFMEYLLSPENTDIVINIDDIQSLGNGLRTTTNLTELVRFCGFDKTLKRAFFKVCKKEKIHFKQQASLTKEQVQSVIKQSKKLEKIVSKT